ncbi:MAG: hypothetical protein EHM41_18935 [Chloroflexi bacterium]|nr:MAG: hypothetical protein EHM41_18935 [Chloroflexota bacterium]
MTPARKKLILSTIVFLLVIAAVLRISESSGAAQSPTPTPAMNEIDMIGFPDMMVAPVLPENPTQADYGRQVYYYVCMTCHGNLGQGLTQEWIDEWGEDNSCWQSKCHASNHPPEGFELPRSIPPVSSSTILNKYGSALVLHDFIRAAMPWHAPSSLSEEEYWQITAYLMALNGFNPGTEPLNNERAANIVFGSEAQKDSSPTVPAMTLSTRAKVAIAIGGLFILAAFLRGFLRKKSA